MYLKKYIHTHTEERKKEEEKKSELEYYQNIYKKIA
jgi:hypothetical protein